MIKWKLPVIVITAAAALAMATVGAGAAILSSAENVHDELHGTYQAVRAEAKNAALSVTEDGSVVGTYDLSRLGILEDTLSAVDNSFHPYAQMTEEEFAQVPLSDRLKWRIFGRPNLANIPVAADRLDLSAVLEDLAEVPRQAPQDAYMDYADGSFRVNAEVAGTTLKEQVVCDALANAVKGLSVGADHVLSASVELTDHACYEQPAITVENGAFDYEKGLSEAVRDVAVTVDFQGKKEVLTEDHLAKVLSVTEQGNVEADKDALAQMVAQWHQTYRNDGSPYLFSAQVGGVKPIDFLPVDYEVNQEATVEKLAQTLVQLETAEIAAEWYCWRKGEAFAIKDNYVEVDIPNQKMTYVKDGEVLVSTDIVTGATWGYPTPPGYYKVENKDTNCWLSGEDYNVHVDYWIGFIGFEIGIHDADWRTKFGGTNYVKNGSHGCINTPKEATALIFENIEVGVPVLVYGK